MDFLYQHGRTTAANPVATLAAAPAVPVRSASGQSAARGESAGSDEVRNTVVAALAEAVRDSDPGVRRQAVYSLAELRAESATANPNPNPNPNPGRPR